MKTKCLCSIYAEFELALYHKNFLNFKTDQNIQFFLKRLDEMIDLSSISKAYATHQLMKNSCLSFEIVVLNKLNRFNFVM